MKEKPSSGTKQFLLTLLATTFSIILTFGTSAIIDRRHKAAAKKEMVMMILYDFDKTIEQLEDASLAFQKAKRNQQELAFHPEYFDSLRFQFKDALMVVQMEFSETTENIFSDALMVVQMEFSETTENIFSSNIETFNTLGNVNFVHEVSSFYSMRHKYEEDLLVGYKKEMTESGLMKSVGKLLKFDFPNYYFMNQVYLKSLKSTRDLCMKMMKVSEDEMKEFSDEGQRG